MAQSQDAERPQRGVVSSEPRTTDIQSSVPSESDSRASEANHPPTRVLPAGGTYTTRQPHPHFDSPADLAGMTLLVPVSTTGNNSRCCHRPAKDSDDEKITHCNHGAEYEEWSLSEIEAHKGVRRCKKCFDSEFGDTLTPEGVYGPATTTCPNCDENIFPFQYGTHIEACLLVGNQPEPEPA